MIRRLEANEFPVLKGIHDGFMPDSKVSIALVAETDEQIVGRVFLIAPVHVEGTWVDESKRGTFIGKQLMDEAEKEAKKIGIKKLFAYGADPQLENYLERLGYEKQPLTVFAKEI